MCVYEKAYISQVKTELKKLCEKGYGWCPESNNVETACETCGGLEDVLMQECFNCDKCHKWGKTQEEEDELRRVM